MCELCLRTPCSSRCPNAKLPRLIGYCDYCGKEIRNDGTERYTDSNRNCFCSFECAVDFHGICEQEDFQLH